MCIFYAVYCIAIRLHRQSDWYDVDIVYLIAFVLRHYIFCGEEVNSIVCLKLQALRYLLSAFHSFRHIVPPYCLLTKRYKLRYCWPFLFMQLLAWKNKPVCQTYNRIRDACSIQ